MANPRDRRQIRGGQGPWGRGGLGVTAKVWVRDAGTNGHYRLVHCKWEGRRVYLSRAAGGRLTQALGACGLDGAGAPRVQAAAVLGPSHDRGDDTNDTTVLRRGHRVREAQ